MPISGKGVSMAPTAMGDDCSGVASGMFCVAWGCAVVAVGRSRLGGPSGRTCEELSVCVMGM